MHASLLCPLSLFFNFLNFLFNQRDTAIKGSQKSKMMMEGTQWLLYKEQLNRVRLFSLKEWTESRKIIKTWLAWRGLVKLSFFNCLILISARTRRHWTNLFKNDIHKNKERRTNEQRKVALSSTCSCAVEISVTGGHEHQIVPSRGQNRCWKIKLPKFS